MNHGDKYKQVSTGKVYSIEYATPRSVTLLDESGEQVTVCRRDFDSQFQEVKVSGRKAASSRK